MKYILLLVSVVLTGCALTSPKPPVEKLVYVNIPLPLPKRPSLPTWSGKDMQCLSPEMKQKLRDRDRLRKEYAEELEAVILSTHSK